MGQCDKSLESNQVFYGMENDQTASPFKHRWSASKTVYSSNQNGSEIYRYHSESGAMEVVLCALSNTSSEMNWQNVLPCSKSILCGGKDGRIRWYNLNGSIQRTIRIANGDSIIGMIPSSNYKQILLHLASEKFVVYNPAKYEAISVKIPNGARLVSMGMFSLDKLMYTCHSDGVVQFWNSENARLVRTFTIPTTITSAVASPSSMTLAIGSENGFVRVYAVPNVIYQPPKLIMKTRVHSSKVLKMEYEPRGLYLATAANDGVVSLIHTFEKTTVVGYYSFPGDFISLQWEKNEEEVANVTHCSLFVMSTGTEGHSLVTTFHVPLQAVPTVNQYLQIELAETDKQSFTIDRVCTDFFVAPKHLIAGKYIVYTSGTDKTTKVYSALNSAEQNVPATISLESVDHRLGDFKFTSSMNGEWLISMGTDGMITLRSLIESEKVIKIQAHAYQNGTVVTACLTLNSKHIYTASHDGLIKRWDWKLNAAGKRAATEAAEGAEKAESEERQFIEDVTQKIIDSANYIEDEQDSIDKTPLFAGKLAKSQSQAVLSNEKQIYKNHLHSKLNAITENILQLISKNDQAPEIERIERQEFIVDLKEKANLLEETEKELTEIKKKQEALNMKNRVLRKRIKEECWDSMEVHGQSIKSFKADQMLGKLLEVSNFPIRKRSQEELDRVNKMKRMRKAQLEIANAFSKNPKPEQANTSENAALLYSPLDLTTKERRRIQAVLLGECILESQVQFNDKFGNYVKMKQDEIAKIEERNERVSAILSQLQLQEQVYHPELDDDEAPERIIEVFDSEIKVERHLTEEERKKIEAKRMALEERMRLNGEDNSRQRALMDMMGGRLEDRKIQEEKEEIVKPEWMNKPKEDMSDEEKKLLKEFEKKMAIFKEEQEKQKKALETELRKIQASILEIQDQFDEKLRDFALQKLNVETYIYKHEVLIIKLTQYALECIEDDAEEVTLTEKIETLKQEKINYTNDIPEIKKELEKCREEYDSAIKRDKEIEKQFRKEFMVHEFYFDTLNKLFKKRNEVVANEEADGDLYPFTISEKESATVELNPAPLNQATDLPDGLSLDIWNKLTEFRDKKIAAEMDVYHTGRLFKEMHSLVQNVLEESDNIKSATQKAIDDLTAFVDHKFNSTYNIEMLMEFKQGQVEVPQAPIVTNYSDAVMIQQTVVEALNERVRDLGKLKVDALTEMKEYRKGIHALEWENKMHDFQAEDLIIRSRDIQLLRVTKEMQEFLRSGDIHRQAAEISNLEKVAEHSQKCHAHHIDELVSVINKIKFKKAKKLKENKELGKSIVSLETSVQERKGIQELKTKQPGKNIRDAHRELFTRRRLVDLAKSQAQDIAILREELERLRLKTYPAFRT